MDLQEAVAASLDAIRRVPAARFEEAPTEGRLALASAVILRAAARLEAVRPTHPLLRRPAVLVVSPGEDGELDVVVERRGAARVHLRLSQEFACGYDSATRYDPWLVDYTAGLGDATEAARAAATLVLGGWLFEALVRWQ